MGGGHLARVWSKLRVLGDLDPGPYVFLWQLVSGEPVASGPLEAPTPWMRGHLPWPRPLYVVVGAQLLQGHMASGLLCVAGIVRCLGSYLCAAEIDLVVLLSPVLLSFTETGGCFHRTGALFLIKCEVFD